MHEARLVRDLFTKIESVVEVEHALRVDRVCIEIGALSHVTPDSLEGHFELLSDGSVSEGAELDIVRSDDENDKDAHDVRLVSVVVSGG